MNFRKFLRYLKFHKMLSYEYTITKYSKFKYLHFEIEVYDQFPGPLTIVFRGASEAKPRHMMCNAAVRYFDNFRLPQLWGGGCRNSG